jgi:hypothetical protein
MYVSAIKIAESVIQKNPEESDYALRKGMTLTGISAGIPLAAYAGHKGLLNRLRDTNRIQGAEPWKYEDLNAKGLDEVSGYEGSRNKIWEAAEKEGWGKNTYGKPVLETRRINPLEARYDIPGKSSPAIVTNSAYGKPEIFAHELGHSMQSKTLQRLTTALENINQKARIGKVPLTAITGALGYGLGNVDKDKSKIQDAAVYGSGAAALAMGAPLMAEEIGASMRGSKLMRAAGLVPKRGLLYGPNLTYLMNRIGTFGVPIALAGKLLYDRIKQSRSNPVD